MGVLDGLKGFKVTFKQLAEPRITTQYPKEKRPKPPRFHGRHVLNRYEDGMEKCIGCELCAGVCPVGCIYVRGKDNPIEDPVSPGERYGFVYEINYLRCIHCDLCVEACPTEAITESKLFEFSFTSREDAIYTKAELVVDDDGKPREMPWEDWREGDDKLDWSPTPILRRTVIRMGWLFPWSARPSRSGRDRESSIPSPLPGLSPLIIRVRQSRFPARRPHRPHGQMVRRPPSRGLAYPSSRSMRPRRRRPPTAG